MDISLRLHSVDNGLLKRDRETTRVSHALAPLKRFTTKLMQRPCIQIYTIFSNPNPNLYTALRLLRKTMEKKRSITCLSMLAVTFSTVHRLQVDLQVL